jgi:hypothetical protein
MGIQLINDGSYDSSKHKDTQITMVDIPPSPSEAFAAPRSTHATGRHHPAATGPAGASSGSGAGAGGSDAGGEWP